MFKVVWPALGLALAGCSERHLDDGPLHHTTKVIELDKAEMVRVVIRMGAGELQVSGGSPRLLDADFSFRRLALEPRVSYHSTGVRGDLTIEQPDSRGPNQGDYRWDLRLNNRVPLDFVANLGAGEARMKLGEAMLRSVEVHMGVGELTLDLRGHPLRDCDVQIQGGVGEANIYLPASAAISATAKGGIGDISVHGLEKRGDRWINPRHDSGPTFRVDVAGGVGAIHIFAE